MDLIKPGEHGSTYGGNPLASVIGIEAVKVIIEENMIENSQIMGERLLKGLKTIKKPYVTDIRGKGLFCAIEFDEKSDKTAY